MADGTATGRVLLIGATGFTGEYVLRRLLDAGHAVTVFARCRQKAESLDVSRGFDIVDGNLDDPASYAAALRGHDTMVSVASLGFGHAPMLVEGAEAAGIRRAVFFSTTALFTTLDAHSKARRQQAEDRIARARFAWTILRPTMISGAPGDRNVIRLIRWVDRHAIVPVFGPGTYRLQPVFVGDLAEAVVSVLASPGTHRRAYNLSGRTIIDYNGLVQLVGKLLGRRPRAVHIPVAPSLLAVRLARWVPGLPKVSTEQVLRLNEHKDFDHSQAVADFGYAPTPLETFLVREVAAYLQSR